MGKGAERIGVVVVVVIVLGLLGGLQRLTSRYAPRVFVATIPLLKLLGLLRIRAIARRLDANPPLELLSLP